MSVQFLCSLCGLYVFSSAVSLDSAIAELNRHSSHAASLLIRMADFFVLYGRRGICAVLSRVILGIRCRSKNMVGYQLSNRV